MYTGIFVNPEVKKKKKPKKLFHTTGVYENISIHLEMFLNHILAPPHDGVMIKQREMNFIR